MNLSCLADLIKIFVAGTFSADIVLSSDGTFDRQKTQINKILSESEPETEPEPAHPGM